MICRITFDQFQFFICKSVYLAKVFWFFFQKTKKIYPEIKYNIDINLK